MYLYNDAVSCYDYVASLADSSPRCVRCTQIRSEDSQVKTQLVLWIFILFNPYPANVENMVSS